MKRVRVSSVVPRKGKRVMAVVEGVRSAWMLLEMATFVLRFRMELLSADKAIRSGNFMNRSAEGAPGQLNNHLGCFRQRSVQRATAGVLMPATAKALGNPRHVHIALAAQRKPYPMIAQLTQKDGDIHP